MKRNELCRQKLGELEEMLERGQGNLDWKKKLEIHRKIIMLQLSDKLEFDHLISRRIYQTEEEIVLYYEKYNGDYNEDRMEMQKMIVLRRTKKKEYLTELLNVLEQISDFREELDAINKEIGFHYEGAIFTTHLTIHISPNHAMCTYHAIVTLIM